MADQPYPAFEFAREQKAAFALVGTVALPSPFPASARIIIGIMPRPKTGHVDRFYLKIVEPVGDKQIVTRFVELEDLRAVRLSPESGRYRSLRKWTLMTFEDIYEELEDVKKTLQEAAMKTGTAYELPLLPGREGVVYVPESAPMLVRVEYAVPAAEAAESARFGHSSDDCPCAGPNPRDEPWA